MKTNNTIINWNCLEVLPTLPDESVNCCITSPPYWGLRDYGHKEQIGLENTPEEYVAKLVEVFREVRRVLKPEGTLWLNLGDSYARNGGENSGCNRELLHLEGKQKRMLSIPKGSGLKPKDLVGIPWRVAFALQADGWYLRQDIIWHKPNPMPESVTDRCTKGHEYIFLLAKSQKYYYDSNAIKEPATYAGYDIGVSKNISPNGITDFSNRTKYSDRNKRSVWTVTTKPFPEAHFATFPEELIRPMVLAGCPEGGVILDPFFGAGTTGVVAVKNNRKYIGIELNPEYIKIAEKRISKEYGLFERNTKEIIREATKGDA